MDLAFLLIATLVLFIQEPIQQKFQQDLNEKIHTQIRNIPSTRVTQIKEKPVQGESIILQMDEKGRIYEFKVNGDLDYIDSSSLILRIKSLEEPRVVILEINPNTDYRFFGSFRDKMGKMSESGIINKIYELRTIQK